MKTQPLFNIGKVRLAMTSLAVLAGLFLGVAAAGESPEAADGAATLKVGVATVDITPETPIRLSGYSNREEEARDFEQRLYAKALAFKSEAAPLSVLMTVDLIGVTEEITETVAERLGASAGLERAQLAICATHTHTGPVVQGTAPTLFPEPFSAEQQQRVEQYAETLIDKLEQAALEAIGGLRESRLAWAQGSVDFAVNRRLMDDGQCVGMGPYPEGPVDHDMPVLAVTDLDGALRAVLVNYACHCTTLTGEHNFIHGDWAGDAAARLEAAYDGLTAMIAIGCGADANPEPRGDFAHVAQHGQSIAEETKRVLDASLRPIHQAPHGELRWVALPFEDEDAEDLSYPIQTWNFGDELAMVFLAGEVVADYALRLKAELDRRRLWVNAYANALPCYIATARVISEGGYEVDRSMEFFGQPGRLSPAVEEIIIQTIHDMLDPAFRRPASEAAERSYKE